MESGERADEEDEKLCANGLSMDASQVEAKLDEGNIKEAESSLREGLSLNFEEARALLGRLEYQRGNMESALRVFEGIELQAAIQRLQISYSERTPPRKGRAKSDSHHPVSQHAACLVLEAIYLKSKSLQKLGRVKEAARECKSVLDAVERIFHCGVPEVQVDARLQETVVLSVELLPELWKQAGLYQEAIIAYRRALLSQWNLDNACCARIQKKFAVLLLYGGVDAAPPSLGFQMDGSYVPKNNLEEAILILMILFRKACLRRIDWDQSIVEHLTFALSVCGQTSTLARQFEEVMPGIFRRVDRWKSLALCYVAAGQNKVALNLLRSSLRKHEEPNDLCALLLAARICSEDALVADEGVQYAQRAVVLSRDVDEHLVASSLQMLGLCLQKQSAAFTSDCLRSRLQSEALKSLEQALSIECDNSELIFDLAMQYAEQRNLTAAMQYAKRFLDTTGGSVLKGWKLLALILSAQQRYTEAEVIIDFALDETAKWEQGPLLRLKAKLKLSQSLPADAVEIYRYLLALVQAQRKSFGPLRSATQVHEEKISEFDVWHGLANLYSSLSHWKDVEICLDKCNEFKGFSVETLHAEGCVLEKRDRVYEALIAYMNVLALEPNHVLTKVALGGLLSKMGPKVLPTARSLLADALRIEPTNRMAWFYLGVAHKREGQVADAADCFQAASMLDETNPVESFSSIL
uniref:Tetratricopeptide repeat protein 7A n=3 Tax=Kalanchoe fedtschenkoi TaxID=63787 RepID=A0A7N0U9Z1_KALFE